MTAGRAVDGLPPLAVHAGPVSGAGLLAYFNDRREQEVVVDPGTLRDVRVVLRPRRPIDAETGKQE